MVCCSSRHQIYTKVFKEGRGRGGQRAGLMGLSPSVWEEALSQSPQHIPWHHIGQDCVIPPPLVAKSWQTPILSYSLGLVILRPEQNWDFASKEARDSAAGRRCSWRVSTSTSQPQHQGAALSRSMASLENTWVRHLGSFQSPHFPVSFLLMFRLRGEEVVTENRRWCSKLKQKRDVVALCSTCLFLYGLILLIL